MLFANFKNSIIFDNLFNCVFWIWIFAPKLLKYEGKTNDLPPTQIATSLTLFENYSKCRILILAFSTNFCPIKTDLSGNTVWPKASGFQKLAKIDHSWPFLLTFVHSKCKRSLLRSQCSMILFLWFSNTVVSWCCLVLYGRAKIVCLPVVCPCQQHYECLFLGS